MRALKVQPSSSHAVAPPPPSPTAEQEHILSPRPLLTKSNLLINALAGSGKTTTLEMIQDALAPPVLCLAFNRRIADVSWSRGVWDNNNCANFQWLGAQDLEYCLRWAYISRSQKKTPDLLRELIKELPRGEQGEAWEVMWDAATACALAKSLGYVPDGKYPNAKRLIDQEMSFTPSSPKDIGSIGPSSSSKRSSSARSNPPTPASSTITIRYICPHCSVVHTRSFRLPSSTKHKTSPPSIIRCSITSQKVGLLQLGTRINQFTDFEEPKLME